MHVDYLVVGQGIGGSLLTDALIKGGKKVMVVDDSHSKSSSFVAAGLYNPIVFRRFIESWMSKELIPIVDEVYDELEQKLNTKFHFKKDIFKIFATDQDQSFWKTKSADTDFMCLLDGDPPKLNYIENDFGGAFVNRSGYVDLEKFLVSYKNYLLKENMLINQKMMPEDITRHDDEISWNGIKASAVLFCEGSAGVNNPFFSWLPFKLTKGELLTIKSSDLEEKYVVNKGVFILPIGNGYFKVGATYNWQDLSSSITEEGKAEILSKLNKIIRGSYQVVEHKAGVRPTVSDRRLFLGFHPEYKNIGIFNGLGTKGVMLAPYFASHFASHLLKNTPLNQEVDIARYYEFYNKN
jgi:glycine oxidase